ncbi:uncharacterized protein LOC144093670 [Amblyomma americanum]
MGTHAYVRYEDDKRCAIVPVEYVKNFDFRADGDYASTFYFVKWIEEDGSSDYYQARILLLGDSEEDLQTKVRQRRVRFWRIVDPARVSKRNARWWTLDVGSKYPTVLG